MIKLLYFSPKAFHLIPDIYPLELKRICHLFFSLGFFSLLLPIYQLALNFHFTVQLLPFPSFSHFQAYYNPGSPTPTTMIFSRSDTIGQPMFCQKTRCLVVPTKRWLVEPLKTTKVFFERRISFSNSIWIFYSPFSLFPLTPMHCAKKKNALRVIALPFSPFRNFKYFRI